MLAIFYELAPYANYIAVAAVAFVFGYLAGFMARGRLRKGEEVEE